MEWTLALGKIVILPGRESVTTSLECMNLDRHTWSQSLGNHTRTVLLDHVCGGTTCDGNNLGAGQCLLR